MEYEKHSEKFSFGFGTMTAAGVGKASDARKIKSKMSTKAILKHAVKHGAKAAGVTAVFLMKRKKKKK